MKLATVLTLLLAAAAQAQPTAFTYQGRLRNGAQPAAGLHDFRFRLWDSASGGTQLGATQCANNVPVAEGLFATFIDFGPQFASMNSRFLEIEVRADTGLDCISTGGFIVLAPRQAITPAPMAGHAGSAFSLAASDGTPANAVVVDSAGNVGIGTGTPTANLQINGPVPAIVLQDTSGTQQGYVELVDSGGVPQGYFGFGSSSSPHSTIWNRRAGGAIQFGTQDQDRMFISGTGNVGIGTITPATTLHLSGQSLWVTGGNGGLLPTSAGAGLRLYDDGSRSNIFAWNYASNTPRNLALQEPGGNVGIGTTSPAAKLDVRGNIRLGSSGQYSAMAGSEDLRLLRGDIDGDGSIIRGTGFLVTRFTEGVYDITFTPAFSGVPTITATAVIPGGAEPRWAFSAPALQTSGFARIIVDTSGSFTDSDFSICVIGPR